VAGRKATQHKMTSLLTISSLMKTARNIATEAWMCNHYVVENPADTTISQVFNNKFRLPNANS
jgi:hypothetical protein